MISRLKRYGLFALAVAAFYFLLSHHIIFTSFTEFDLLKKAELTLKYTFFSLQQASPAQVLRIDVLRNAGIEDVMLKRNLITEQKLNQILNTIDQGK